MPVAVNPRPTNDDTRLYINTISYLAYIDIYKDQGIIFTDHPNPFFMILDLTSTQQASHIFNHPELTNCTLSVELKFPTALPDNIEIINIGKKLVQFLRTKRAGFQQITVNQLMDKDDTDNLIQKCRRLKFNFCGVFAAKKL